MLNKSTLAMPFLSLGLFLPGVLLANREVISPMAGMGFFLVGGLLGLVAVILSILVMFKTRHFAVALVGMLGMMPFLVLVSAIASGLRYPPINDISTDLENVPAFVHAPGLPANAGRNMAFPADFAPIIRTAYPKLQPLTLPLHVENAYARALETARTGMKGWEITYEDPVSHSFEAVSRTRLLHWRDDVVVRVTASGDEASRVDMRSKSREGKGDLGANAHRIEQYFQALDIKR